MSGSKHSQKAFKKKPAKEADLNNALNVARPHYEKYSVDKAKKALSSRGPFHKNQADRLRDDD